MTTLETPPSAGQIDSQLVAASRSGNREAFRRIVERYQVLVCSLAYSATGSVTRSEDVAQETFLSAWKELGALREPEKLRSWLCGIARHRLQRSARSEGRDPTHNAAPLEEAERIPAPEALPSDEAVTREEETILWRSLGRIPEDYREPLILYYRQHQSVATVAAELDLSEDTVRQRLSRGRKLLQDEVNAFLEGALLRTAPGTGFTSAVYEALPLAVGSAATAGAGAKGAAAAKSAHLLGLLGPVGGMLAGFASQWLVIRDLTPERDRRSKLTRLVVTWTCLLAVPIAGEASVRWLGRALDWGDRGMFTAVAVFWCCFAMALATWLIRSFRTESATQRKWDEAARLHPPRGHPLTPVQTALVVGGIYLSSLSWLIAMTWRLHDRTAFLSLLAVSPVLCAWSFLRLRSARGERHVRDAWGFAAVCCAVVVAAANLRLGTWMATVRGVSVPEIRSQLPLWIVPLLTLALIAWCGAALALTRPRATPA